MHTVLTGMADAAAVTSGFMQRRSKLTGTLFAQTLVFGWLANAHATLEALAQTATTRGLAITLQGLKQRLLRPCRDARDKGQAVTQRTLMLAAWTLLLTTVPAAMLTVAEALVLLRVRWQMELLFKRWKSHGRIDESRSAKPWRVVCDVYAKLLAMVVQHWLLLVGCSRYPDWSVVKAVHTVRKHALHLASGFGSITHLTRVIAIIQRCFAAGCRVNRRKKAPNTCQLLLALRTQQP